MRAELAEKRKLLNNIRKELEESKASMDLVKRMKVLIVIVTSTIIYSVEVGKKSPVKVCDESKGHCPPHIGSGEKEECVNSNSNVNNDIYSVSNEGVHCTNIPEEVGEVGKEIPVKVCDESTGHCPPHIESS